MKPSHLNQTHGQDIKSIVVLPFVNMSSDHENEYFSDGITEEIINALTKIQGLKVIARTSAFTFKNQQIDVRVIGRQLGVSTVLEGSVRKAGKRVRITAQLINAEDGSHLWSKNFDRELSDIFVLQDEVSLLIADQIRENYGHLELPSPTTSIPTQKLEAYDFFLRGNFHLKRKDFDDIKKAIHLFEQAIKIDPEYSDVYSSMGEAYIHAAGFGIMTTKDAHELARKSAAKAISLNKKNPWGHKVMAYIHLYYDWDWENAILAYERAIQCGMPDQNEFISYYYVFIDEDFERAIEVAKNGTKTDPLHAISHWQLGLIYYFARRFKDAISAFDAALDVDPNFGEALRFRGLVWGYLEKYQKALTDINRALELSGGQGLANQDMMVVQILMGKRAEVLRVLEQTEFIDSSDPAFLYSLLNQPKEALHYLEKALEERSVMMVSLKNFWVWDNLREEARFKAIFDQMNFPPSIEGKESLRSIGKQETVSHNSLMSAQKVEACLERLNNLMAEELVFKDPGLSLRELAEKISLNPNKLSWLLNEHIGKNFNEYVNTFRLEDFKIRALDPANSQFTLLGLAYESGFNSKTAFNSFFKKLEGQSPRQWVKGQTK